MGSLPSTPTLDNQGGPLGGTVSAGGTVTYNSDTLELSATVFISYETDYFTAGGGHSSTFQLYVSRCLVTDSVTG